MKVIIYGDFNCPYSYLASQRAGQLMRGRTVEIDWRAVEHDRWLPATGTRSDSDRAAWNKELAEVAALALPGEHPPAAPPPMVSNTKAAVAAYAEALSDGIQDELRRRLFDAIWVHGRNLSGAYDVRRVLTELMWQPGPLPARLATPDLAGALDHDPHLTRIVRRSGGTITPDGGPLTTVGYRRIACWRQQWLALPQQVVPAVIGPDGGLHPGIGGLDYLARLVNPGSGARRGLPDSRPAGHTALPRPGRQPAAAAQGR